MISDQQLIQNILDGNSRAFETLVLRYQDKMYSVCLSILKNKAEAQEAAQDTFIKLHKALEGYKSEAKFSSWLYKIAYRTSLDYIRKRKVTSDIDQIDQSGMTDSTNPSGGIEKSELSTLLDKVIDELHPDEAGLVRMFYLEEMNIKELEEVTGMSNSNVKVKLFRARKKLSEIVQDQYSEIQEYLH